MPKIEAELKIKTTPFTVKIREDWQQKITAYGHFLNPESPSSPGYVLTDCFKQVAEKDPDFAAFLKDFHPRPAARPARPKVAKTGA